MRSPVFGLAPLVLLTKPNTAAYRLFASDAEAVADADDVSARVLRKLGSYWNLDRLATQLESCP